MLPTAGNSLRFTSPISAAAFLAIGLPCLLAFNLPPSATFLNQALALFGWGAWLMVLAKTTSRGAVPCRALAALLGGLGLLAVAALGSPLWTGLPSTLSMSSAGVSSAAALTALSAALVQREGQGRTVFIAFCMGLIAAGAASAAIGVLQVFAPDWIGGNWVAQSGFEGRAVGNLRQPNHLSSLLLWSIAAAVWLGASGVLDRVVSWGTCALLLLGLVLSASRTGMVGAVMLALWGLADRRLDRGQRLLLWLLPLLYVALWLALTGSAAPGEHPSFGGDRQLHRSDISNSRFGIWSNTLALIAAHPWSGVGFGEFNFAWTLTPFPNRPVAFFDHTHNLPLQLAVELGLPLATLILALLGWALWNAFKAARDADEECAHLRPAFVMVLMIGVHSLLEYPLWYAYFLLPTAFAWGLCLSGSTKPGTPRPEQEVNGPPTRGSRTRPLLIASMLLVIGGLYSIIDYWKVVVIFAPPENAPPLSQRILEGRKSIFFGHHADYAAATSVPEPGNVMPAFKTATHFLLDTRLMVAWAQAYAAHGDLDRARHIAARLREFRNPASDEFFAPCDKPEDPAAPKPFQCQPPSKVMDYRDFR